MASEKSPEVIFIFCLNTKEPRPGIGVLGYWPVTSVFVEIPDSVNGKKERLTWVKKNVYVFPVTKLLNKLLNEFGDCKPSPVNINVVLIDSPKIKKYVFVVFDNNLAVASNT